MSIFNKIKDVLFDIEEDEEVIEVKKEKKVVDENPIKELTMPREEGLKEVETPKKTSNFNFPLDFDDEIPSKKESSRVDSYASERRKDYFEDDYDIPRRVKSDYQVRETSQKKDEVRDYSKFLQPKKEEKKIFTPSPVISPVYGILNQNYTKDDVIVKTDSDIKSPSLDEVRKKAYKKQENPKEEKEVDEFEEPLKTLDEILINGKIETEEVTITQDKVQESDDKTIDTKEPLNKIDQNIEDEEVTNEKDDLLEKDLFNLIDSMYEDKEEEEE